MVFGGGYQDISVKVYPSPGLVLVIFFSGLCAPTKPWQVIPEHYLTHIPWGQTYNLRNFY